MTGKPRGRPFEKGTSGCPTGRPRGIVDKRMRLQQSIRDNIAPVIAMLQAKAAEGDVAAAALLLSRGIAPLRAASDDSVSFQFDASKPLADQLTSITQAVANGELTLEQGERFAKLAESLATVRAMENGGNSAETELINVFKQMAQRVPA